MLILARMAPHGGQGRQEVRSGCTLLRAAPERFPIHRHRLLSVWGPGRPSEKCLGPRADLPFEPFAVEPAQDGVERRGTGGAVGKAQRLHEMPAIIPFPLRDGGGVPQRP